MNFTAAIICLGNLECSVRQRKPMNRTLRFTLHVVMRISWISIMPPMAGCVNYYPSFYVDLEILSNTDENLVPIRKDLELNGLRLIKKENYTFLAGGKSYTTLSDYSDPERPSFHVVISKENDNDSIALWVSDNKQPGFTLKGNQCTKYLSMRQDLIEKYGDEHVVHGADKLTASECQ